MSNVHENFSSKKNETITTFTNQTLNQEALIFNNYPEKIIS